MVSQLRAWLAKRLGLKDQAARDGTWWEIDFILVLFVGSVIWGAWGFLS